jgi:hypothetical protein
MVIGQPDLVHRKADDRMTHHETRTWITLGAGGPPHQTEHHVGTWGYIYPAYLMGCRATVHHACPIHTLRISKWFRTAAAAYHWYQQQYAHLQTCPRTRHTPGTVLQQR